MRFQQITIRSISSIKRSYPSIRSKDDAQYRTALESARWDLVINRKKQVTLSSEALKPLSILAHLDTRQFPGGQNHARWKQPETWVAWFNALLSDPEANLEDAIGENSETDAA
jgi:hypothetical protein